jgi:DDE superfamily endonuclease
MAPVQSFPAVVFSELQMLQVGLESGGHKLTGRSLTNLRRFRDLYGLYPKAASVVFLDLQTFDLGQARIEKVSLLYFFMSLYYARGYGIETRVMGVFRLRCPETFRNHVWKYLTAFQALKAKKVRKGIMLYNFFHVILIVSDYKCYIAVQLSIQIVWCFDENLPVQADEARLFATIDGIHCQILEPRVNDPGPHWWSHKSNGPAVTYELVIHTRKQQLMWIKGPKPAATKDITMTREPDGILGKIPDGKKIIGDKAYRGEPDKISAPNPHDSLVSSTYKSRARSRHETFNKRIKDFQIISQPFRNMLDKHQIAFEAICVLVQYDIETDNPLFDV